MPPALAEVVEDEQDHSLLSGLELDQQAALVELRGSQQAMAESDEREYSPRVPVLTNINQSQDSPASTSAVPNSHATIDAGLIQDLQAEIESLRSSTQDSFHSACEGVSDRVWQQSQRLSLLLAKDQSIISQRWSQSIPNSRPSYVPFSRQAETSQLPSDLSSSSASSPVQTRIRDSTRNLGGLAGAISPGQLAESYCFSCFDLMGFEENAKLADILPILSRRYDLGLGRDWGLYSARLVAIQRGIETEGVMSMLASPLQLFRKWAALKKSCVLVLHRRIEGPNASDARLAGAILQPPRQGLSDRRPEKDDMLEHEEQSGLNVSNRDMLARESSPDASTTGLSTKLLAPISAKIPRYFFADTYWYVVGAEMEDGRCWCLQRLYQEFYDLQIGLLQKFPLEAGSVKGHERTLPYMPGPVTYVTDDITNGRRAHLEEYIGRLLKLGPHISKGNLVCNFFTPRQGDYELDAEAVRSYRMSTGSQDAIDGQQTVNSPIQPNPPSSADKDGPNDRVEPFKSFRVSIDDPCWKVLPVALKKYNITADWGLYSLWIVIGDQERCLEPTEKPLIVFKQLDSEGKNPMFMLRKLKEPVQQPVAEPEESVEEQPTPEESSRGNIDEQIAVVGV